MGDDNAAAAVAAVAIKMLRFWPADPNTWIQQVEAQFALRNITQDDTKFYHVVAALDPPTARRLRHTIKTAPPGERYTALRGHLVSTFGLRGSDRANRVLNMPGLGDRSPSELMDEMLALAEGHEPCFLFKQVFLNHMPPDLQLQLATQEFTDAHEFSLLADQLWRTKITSGSPIVAAGYK